MKNLILALAIIIYPAERIFAAGNSVEGFESPAVNNGGVLRLKATETYGKWKEDARKTAVETQSLSYPGTSVAVVEYAGNGEFWTFTSTHAALADSWSRREMRFGRHAQKAGRWFGYVGGQFVRGGDMPSNGWTGRLGTTLFKNRYDTAISVSHNSFSEVEDSGMTTIGLTMRALYPYTRHVGLNLGIQLDRTSYTGYSHISPSAIGGINIYLPGGSFDVSLSLGEEGRASLLAGYTIFISK